MSATINRTHCPACFGSAIAPALRCTDFTVSKQVFEVWHCADCTLRFTQDVPDAGAIGAYYQSEDYVSHSDSKKGLINRLYHLVRSHTLKTKRNLVQSAANKQQGSLLDVGAGTGAFAHTMSQAGWKVTALEPEEKARQNALATYNLQLHSLERLFNLNAESFDVITLWHVLEHVHELQTYLVRFSELLAPGGTLVIAVPNYTSYDAHVYGQYWAAYDVPRHLYHFSPQSMESLASKNGFSLASLKPMWFDSFYVSMLSERYKNGGGLISAVWNGALSNIKALLSTGRCSSVIYILKK